MTRYFFVVLLMGLVGIAIVVKGAMIMFAERQYWHDVADRFVKENVTVKPNRGNILSSDGKLMASSLPEYMVATRAVSSSSTLISSIRTLIVYSFPA